jgi:hypothetical protein
MKNGAELIAEERRRQIEKEGWTAEHDDEHTKGEMALVAALYASPIQLFKKKEQDGNISFIDPWPWYELIEMTRYESQGGIECVKARDKRKKHSRKRTLIIAGALIAAEIDRIQRCKKTIKQN